MKHKISKAKEVNKILNELTEDIKDRIILIEIKRNGKVEIYLKENQKKIDSSRRFMYTHQHFRTIQQTDTRIDFPIAPPSY